MENKNFRPYIPASKVTPELTVTSIVLGIILAVVFGAANAYLGLRVGMTVSASIPAAVISMGVIRIIMRKDSILENNLVQTIGSAGESLAAGAIFTLPALFIWAREGVEGISSPSILTITLIAVLGGLLGVFFMIPLRNALIVKEHGVLPYPEGQACAEVLLAGEKGGSRASTVFVGMGFAAAVKFILGGLKISKETLEISGSSKTYPGSVSTDVSPAVLSVGYICGPRISSYMFAGGLLSYMVLIPMIVLFAGGEAAATFDTAGAGALRSEYIVYIGAGALATGGLISLLKNLPLIVSTFKSSIKSFSFKANGTERTAQDLPMPLVLIVLLAITIAIWLVPAVPVPFLGALIIVIFGFFFATVSSRMVGLVGSSNNPVSGMAIATILAATLILKSTGTIGATGMVAAIAIGSIICIVAAISGDTSQDLKTGYLLGATPKKQQIGEVIGVLASALAIGATLYLLDSAYHFGSDALGAPQATMMKTIVEGIMEGSLPWGYIGVGVCIALIIEVIGIPVLPFAIGLYLPLGLNACIMIGGIIRWFFDRMKNQERRDEASNKGILYCSGMIAGEGLMGIIMAVLTVITIGSGDASRSIADHLNIGDFFTAKLGEGTWDMVSTIIGGVVLLAIVGTLTGVSLKKEKANKNAE